MVHASLLKPQTGDGRRETGNWNKNRVSGLRSLVSSLRSLVLSFALAALLFAIGCAAQRPQKDVRYQPAESLLEIVKEFQRYLREDTYRFPARKDPSGVNIYKATIARLEDYEGKHPGEYAGIIAHTKAMAYERLHEYSRAVASYRQVSELDPRLRPQAEERIEILEAMKRLSEAPIPSEDPQEHLKALEERAGAWRELGRRYRGTVYESLAKEEEERMDQAKVAFLKRMRSTLAKGDELVIGAFGTLITKHGESKHVDGYLLEFGDFYVELAKEYVARHDPEGLSFDWRRFKELEEAALKLYAQVAQRDGTLEKQEARGKLEALKAYSAKIQTLYR